MFIVDHSEYPCRCNSSSSVVMESSPSLAFTSSIACSNISECPLYVSEAIEYLFPFCLFGIDWLLRSVDIFLVTGSSIPETVCICQCSGKRTQQQHFIGSPEGNLIAISSIRRVESVLTSWRPTRHRSTESPHRGYIQTYPCRHNSLDDKTVGWMKWLVSNKAKVIYVERESRGEHDTRGKDHV
jgi:hypothetical protein